MDFVAFAEALQATPFGQWAGQSSLAYPLANVIHLLGLVMLVGGIGLLDLRLAGAFKSLPVVPLSRVLTPIAIAGLLILIPSGLTMFAADAPAMAASPVFQTKLVLVALALANAVAFRRLWGKHLDRWDLSPPGLGRAMTIGSILLWLAIATCGRLIAYF